MELIEKIINKAKKVKGKIILPEAVEDKRVYNACKKMLKDGLTEIIVFGKVDDFDQDFKTKT